MNAKGPTSDRLRHLIDRGETGDKIPAFDPAAAPLGTDDEAAGMSPDGTSVERAIQQETGRGVSGPVRGRAARTKEGDWPAMSAWKIAALIVAACLTAVAIVVMT